MESGDQGATTEQEAMTAGQLQEQIDRYFHRTDRPANVVQFAPRRPAATADQERPAHRPGGTAARGESQPHAISQFPVDTATRDGINATIQELLFCANVGELLHGFALYSDRFLFQFMDDSAMSEDEFRQAYSDVPAKDPSEWIRIDSISGFTRLPDGRVMVRVRYIDGAEVNGTEQLTMKFDNYYERWLIDDIRAI